jgi:hypothetical protein
MIRPDHVRGFLVGVIVAIAVWLAADEYNRFTTTWNDPDSRHWNLDLAFWIGFSIIEWVVVMSVAVVVAMIVSRLVRRIVGHLNQGASA